MPCQVQNDADKNEKLGGRDITENIKSEKLIWQQANFDALTGLANRRMLQDRLEQELRKSHRSNLPLALMVLDLDRLKVVNETLGHEAGDSLLREATRRLLNCAREVDTVARLGGDEFAVILSELHDISSVDRIAQAILRKLEEPYLIGGQLIDLSTSIGITLKVAVQSTDYTDSHRFSCSYQ